MYICFRKYCILIVPGSGFLRPSHQHARRRGTPCTSSSRTLSRREGKYGEDGGDSSGDADMQSHVYVLLLVVTNFLNNVSLSHLSCAILS